MADKKDHGKEIKLSCTSDYAKKTQMMLGGNMADHMAIVQALQFVIEHKAEFQKQCQCPNCFKSIEDIQGEISAKINEAHEHYIKHHAN